MKTPEEIAQWVINNRYQQNEKQKISDAEMYHTLVESIANLCNLPVVSDSALIDTPLTYCPKCKSTDIRQYTKGTDKCNNCNHAWDIYRPFKGVE